MKISPHAPNTLDWLQARCGIPTASEFGNIVTNKLEPRRGEMVDSYLAQKLAERWQGTPLTGYQSIDMEIGQILEDRAIPFFQLEYGIKIQRVGLVTNDAGTAGCSPDGLIGDDCGIEIKCPRAETHVKYLLNGHNNFIPDQYRPQVHGSMWVTGRAHWVFMSYRPGFPPLVVNVDRDEHTCAMFDEAIGEFLLRLDAGWKILCEKNGGPPKRREPFQQYVPKPKPAYVPTEMDIPT